MATLRDRCRDLYQQIQRDAILRQGNPVETLHAFVLAEQGRAADKSLAETLPLVLYFPSDAGRDEFIAAVREAKPGMIAKRLP